MLARPIEWLIARRTPMPPRKEVRKRNDFFPGYILQEDLGPPPAPDPRTQKFRRFLGSGR